MLALRSETSSCLQLAVIETATTLFGLIPTTLRIKSKLENGFPCTNLKARETFRYIQK